MTQQTVMYKEQPSDKKDLLESEGYEMFNRELMRKVFPRIIGEIKQQKPSAKTGDIIPFYFALLSYIDGNRLRADGNENMRYGYSFPSQNRIYEMTGINQKRHKLLTDILHANGILADVRDYYEGTKRYKWYKPSFCPRVSDDGYLVDENGAKIIPNYDEIL
ncbi:hypothetical protein MHI02_05670 [Oceanobacillus sp. FSL K6-0118]|uniref:hypothetical protein n=1 Tax=Oceanobacillus sp. FSL K6-0118 TaxID=2921418 RepID=UPI0030F51E40